VALQKVNPNQHIEDALIEVAGDSIVQPERAYVIVNQLTAQGRKNAEGGAIEATKGAANPDHPSTRALAAVEDASDVATRGVKGKAHLIAAELVCLDALQGERTILFHLFPHQLIFGSSRPMPFYEITHPLQRLLDVR
jgi:hypothetical protein